MSADHTLYDLVAEWDQRRQEGEELPAAALCEDRPDLIPALEECIASVKATDWLLEPDDEDDDFPSLAPELIGTFRMPASVSLEQLCSSIVASGLLTADQVQQAEATDAGDLAARLLRAEQLTEYQVQQIAEGNTTGLVLGNYVILDKIDSGGMGTVFKARHKRMKRVVALKTVSKKALDSPAAVERFRREVEAAARLNHSNIVMAYDADEHEGTHFLVMEFVNGQDLWSLVEKQGRMPVGEAVDCIIQAARGLQYVHHQGVIHRDIKPANLLLNKTGVVKILDMGLARLEKPDGTDGFVAEQAKLTADEAVLGTIDYLAPEQALDTHTADARADVYSLGCTLYYLLTGRPLFRGGSLMAKMLAHREKEIPSLRKERQDVPERLATIFEKMVAKEPDARFATMTALLEELEAVAGEYEETWGLPSSQATAVDDEADVDLSTQDTDAGDTLVSLPKIEPQQTPTPRPKVARNRRGPFAGGVVGLLLLGLLGYWLFGILFNVETPHGIIRIETNVTDVEIYVDDAKVVYLTDPKDESKIRVEIPQGAETLRVRKEGFEAEVNEFKLNTVKGPIKVTFVPLSKTGEPSDAAVIDPTEIKVQVVGAALVITGTNGGNTHDDLELATSGGNLTITADLPAHTINIVGTITGAAGHGTDSVTIPLSAFTNLVVNTLAGNDTIKVDGIVRSSDLVADLVINGGDGDDRVIFRKADTNIGQGDLRVTAETILVDDIDVDGVGIETRGSVEMTAARNIYLGPGSSITVNAADGSHGITLRANAGQAATVDSVGIELNAASVTTDVGFIHLDGTGGTTDTGAENYGVWLRGGALVSAGNDCEVTVKGRGGLGAGEHHDGVRVQDTGSQITSGGGRVEVTGTGGGRDGSTHNFGVLVTDGGQITAGAGGSATVDVTGTGGVTGGSYNRGVVVGGAGSITSRSGNVTVNGTSGGTGAGAYNDGVAVGSKGTISAGGNGEVRVTGEGGQGSGSYNQGVFLLGNGSKITSSGGNVIVTGTGHGKGNSNYNVGVDLGGGEISAGGSGTVTVSGTGGAASGGENHGVLVRTAGGIITSSGGDVLVRGTAGTGSGTYAVALAFGGAIGDSVARPNVRIVATGPVWEDETSRIVANALGIDASDASVGPKGDVLLGAGPNDVNTLEVKAAGREMFRDVKDGT